MRKAFAGRILLLAALVGSIGVAGSVETPWFGAAFGDYVVGEALSEKGTWGGRWDVWSSATTVTNAPTDGLGAMTLTSAVDLPQAALTASVPAGEDLWQVDVRLKPDSAWDYGTECPAGTIAVTFVPGETADSQLDCAGIVEGTWHRLRAAGVAFACGEWIDIRIKARAWAGMKVVGFEVVREGAPIPLATATGTQWFEVKASALAAIRTALLAGRGHFSDFSATRSEPSEEPAAVAQTWVGGADGAWEVPDNWSAAHVPATNELVKIDGHVTLTYGVEQATVSNALVRVESDGRLAFVAGALRTAVTLDTSRPRVGHPLSVQVASFAGVTPAVTVRWLRGRTIGTRDYVCVGTERSLTLTVADYEHWFCCEVSDEYGPCLRQEFFCSKLPVIYLTTDDGTEPTSKKEVHTGTFRAQGNDAWKSPDACAMTIKVRGNSTASRPKKPWKVKLAEKTKLFGLAKSKHWVLLANWYDESLMRNKLAYDFANQIGSKGMRSEWVECVLNGAWQGCYQLCEQIRIEKNRVDIFDWEDEAEARGIPNGDLDLNWVDSAVEDITGGYLFEFDDYYDAVSKFTVTAGNLELKTMIDAPEYLASNGQMMDWCQTFIRNYAEAITSEDGYSAEGRHYSEYCDVESMVAYFLVQEMFGNEDARCRSNYAYKDRGDVMRWGPVWDFDWGTGNYQLTYAPEAWLTNYEKASFTREWADDPWFCTLLWTRYRTARPAFAAICAEGGVLDEAARYLAEAGGANDRLWMHHYGFEGGLYGISGHPGLKAYLKCRLAWLDRQFRDVPTLMASLKAGATRIASTHPYTAAVKTLPMRLVNAPQQILCDGEDLHLTFNIQTSKVARVGVYVNGLALGNRFQPLHARKIELTIPQARLTARLGEPNCISLVGRTAAGAVLARNYALVTVAEATEPMVDRTGAVVPSVPYRWIGAALAGADGDWSQATPAELADALVRVPSAWGKASPLWQDYVAGTDPANPDDHLRITSFTLTNAVPSLTWAPGPLPGRVYTLWGASSLTNAVWQPIDWHRPAPTHRFFSSL